MGVKSLRWSLSLPLPIWLFERWGFSDLFESLRSEAISQRRSPSSHLRRAVRMLAMGGRRDLDHFQCSSSQQVKLGRGLL